MFKWFGKGSGNAPTPLKYPKHYSETARTAPGGPEEVLLEETDLTGSLVTLVYRWADELDHQEADRLDSRLRAFVACAIPDAASAAELKSSAGPPHGQRPSWLLGESRMPISVVQAGFDLEEKQAFVTIGPVMPARAEAGSDQQAQRLLSGFKLKFSRIRV